MASTYTPIASQTLSSPQTAVTFTSIPQTYTDLVMVMNCGIATSDDYPLFRVGNGSIDTGTNYSYTRLSGDGSSATSSRASNVDSWGFNSLNATNPGNYAVVMHIQNYSNTSVYKTSLISNGIPTIRTDTYAGLWRSTSAIDTVQFLLYYSVGGRAYATGSTFTLYGIKAA